MKELIFLLNKRNMQTVIEVKNIGKTFKLNNPLLKQIFMPFSHSEKIYALKNISFSVEAGQILALVGANGSGKTTLIRIIADLMLADDGAVNIVGQDVKNKGCQIRKKIGYVSSDERSFFWKLTGRENLKFFGCLYGLPERLLEKRIDCCLAEFDFEKESLKLFRDYSAGMRKKLTVIRALLHSPEILLLDEITNSLDQESSEKIKSIIKKYVCAASNRAAIWSTHRLEEINQLSDQVLMIKHGQVVFLGDAGQFSYYLKKEKQLSIAM